MFFYFLIKQAQEALYKHKRAVIVEGASLPSKQGLPFLAFRYFLQYDDQLIKYYYPRESDYEVLNKCHFFLKENKKKSESFKKGDNPILIYYTLNKSSKR